jgi:streptomycin 6-kinase
VLKVGWPHPEAREEGSALVHWRGTGSVELYEEDRDAWALLMERCDPGVPLGQTVMAPADAITIAAGVLQSLWLVEPPTGGPFDRLAETANDWANLVRSRMDELRPPYDRGLVDMGAGLLETLPATANRNVLVHGDFNPGNILSTHRQGWAAIDAKPMIGDPAFDPAPLLLQVDPPMEQPDPGRALAGRTELLADLVGESSARILGWTAARSVEWALWYASKGRPSEGLEELEDARLAARLAGV